MVGQLFHPGDMVAMFSTGPSSIEIPVSYDKRLLQEAISRVGGHGMSYRDIMDSLDGAQGPQGLRYNAHVAFKTAYELIGNLERMGNRRKVLLLVSNGYDFDPFPGGRTGTDQVFGGRYGTPDGRHGARRALPPARGAQHNHFADSDLAAEIAAVTGAANRVNAAVYTLDPRGVVGTTNLEQNVDIGELRTHISQDAEQPEGAGRLHRRLRGGQRQPLRRRPEPASTPRPATTTSWDIRLECRSEAPQPAGRGQDHPAWGGGGVAGLVSDARSQPRRHPSPEPSRQPTPCARSPTPTPPGRARCRVVSARRWSLHAGDAVADGRGGVGPKRR